MAQSGINLQELQEAVIGVPKDLILPESYVDQSRSAKQQTIRKIVEMYSTCRTKGRIYKSTYDALSDSNPYVRVAAADLISQSGTNNSFEYLFKALEDEENAFVRKEIVRAIKNLETRMNRGLKDEDSDSAVSLIDSIKILSEA